MGDQFHLRTIGNRVFEVESPTLVWMVKREGGTTVTCTKAEGRPSLSYL